MTRYQCGAIPSRGCTVKWYTSRAFNSWYLCRILTFNASSIWYISTQNSKGMPTDPTNLRLVYSSPFHWQSLRLHWPKTLWRKKSDFANSCCEETRHFNRRISDSLNLGHLSLLVCCMLHFVGGFPCLVQTKRRCSIRKFQVLLRLFRAGSPGNWSWARSYHQHILRHTRARRACPATIPSIRSRRTLHLDQQLLHLP